MGIGDLKQEPYWPQSGQTFWNYHLIEVLVFLFLIVPSMALSFKAKTKISALTFTSAAAAITVQDLSVVSLVFYFIWRNGESLQSLGWNRKNGWREVFLGVILFLPFIYTANILENLLRQVGFSEPAKISSFLSVHGLAEIVLGTIFLIIVALTEETIFRGYLILRFQGAHMGSLAAALLSTLVFSLGHGYEGTVGVITVCYFGLAFALIYLWRGSLIAPAILHFLQDFTGIILPALLK